MWKKIEAFAWRLKILKSTDDCKDKNLLRILKCKNWLIYLSDHVELWSNYFRDQALKNPSCRPLVALNLKNVKTANFD